MTERIGDDLGLLVDFLLHEVAMVALVGQIGRGHVFGGCCFAGLHIFRKYWL
ncbi:hypothetical protein [Rhizobium sp. 007]|uniref:hypothetical protein n=1 Tax=Rhizobium sp. 007 TaxID=2785056 RepID=UPI00188F963F|nr:hypothetical protein [Rhizobium sp. 007]QPB24870.1 hypothetical protein ISN39_34260 [Rhizobium sp. 007]